MRAERQPLKPSVNERMPLTVRTSGLPQNEAGIRRATAADSVAWTVVTLVILWSIPVGFVSGDGIAHSVRFANGSWLLNPNHLLFEPAGAAWQALLTRLGLPRSHPDQLKLLSMLAGSISAGLFRAFVIGPIVTNRMLANCATGLMAFSAAFLGLWISDEIHMLQMPFLVAAAAAAIAFLRRESWTIAALCGLLLGMATLVFASNILIALALAIALASHQLLGGRVKQGLFAFAAIFGTAMAVVGGGLLLGWTRAQPGTGFLAWALSYGGDANANRLATTYGAELSPRGIAVATARSIYGAGNSILDASPLLAALRDTSVWSVPLVTRAVAALLAACFILIVAAAAWRRRHSPSDERFLLLLCTAWTLVVVGFGALWNNSDDQFFFQLAVPFGVLSGLALTLIRRWWFTALAASVIVWNAYDVTTRLILYPRSDLVSFIDRGTSGAGLVVYPGWDETDQLLYFAKATTRDQRLSIASLAADYNSDEGMEQLRQRIAGALANGQRVDVVSIFDVPQLQNPWKFLADGGYNKDRVEHLIEQFGVESHSRTLGQITLRSIRPPSGS
jgi:hypothetical protein